MDLLVPQELAGNLPESPNSSVLTIPDEDNPFGGLTENQATTTMQVKSQPSKDLIEWD